MRKETSVRTTLDLPEGLLEAAQRMGIASEACAYVGDRVDRDVAAARSAGSWTASR